MHFLLCHAMFPAPVKVDRLYWTRFRELRKWSPALSFLQQSILEFVSMTTTTMPWWLLLPPWRWPCQRVPTPSNRTATEVSWAQSLVKRFIHEFKAVSVSQHLTGVQVRLEEAGRKLTVATAPPTTLLRRMCQSAKPRWAGAVSRVARAATRGRVERAVT